MFGNQLRALLGTLALLPAARCIAFGGPAPTDIGPEKALNGFTPKPTQGPSIAELRKRQRGLEANTCGWIDHDYSSWVTCRTGRTCALYTASGVGMAGCCDGSDHQACGWASSCVDYRQYYSSSACDLDCDLNTFIRKCTDAAAPYCVTWTYASNNVKDFGCVETSSRTVETIYFGASLFSSSTSVKLLTLSGKDVVTSTTGISSNLLGFTSNFLGLTTGTDAAQETDPVAVGGGGGGGRNKKKKKSKVSIGLIVGVAIAGIAVLFITGAIILFFCLKAKRRRQLVQPQTAGAGTGVPPAGSYNPQMHQQQQVPPPIPPVGSPQLLPPQHGYFAPGAPPPQSPYGQPVDQKGVYHYEQPVPSPVSSPSPAPAYVQPYYAPTNGAPPMPTPSPGPYPISGPPPQQPQGGHIHEIGGGR